jgi:hypothetical protein
MNIVLKALRLEVPVPGDIVYADQGYVKDVETQRKRNCKTFENPYAPHGGGGTVLGSTQKFERGRYYVICVCYARQEDALFDLRLRGHEETHALENMGMIAMLQQRLSERWEGLFLSDFASRDVRACIGGWYALAANGFELTPMPMHSDHERTAFDAIYNARRRL